MGRTYGPPPFDNHFLHENKPRFFSLSHPPKFSQKILRNIMSTIFSELAFIMYLNIKNYEKKIVLTIFRCEEAPL
jgi:hypothetical protein